ncbi:S16 family serine protease [endosymbiont GvMRE of Glomus versiforme]|uniref:S16 family serine protease n=1 Tax=endosymbiont GvMRE of Glomus versiforme TaxID=2039283 RepID=UPI000EC4BCA8|nr:S16 family serine protease [endosymbiont GvMRE of Glomus versiforme]RHZ36624.1 Lon protease [endosymbiont GvMRE of Glomus versiforme]
MFKSFLFHRWTKTVLRITNLIFGVIFLFLLGWKFADYNKTAKLDVSFLPLIFFLILAYFYYLFTEWLIKKITTYQLDQNQFFQVLQEKKLVVEGQEYQVEKIAHLQVRFHSRIVNFQGILIIPQEDDYLKLNFLANSSLDYYKQQLFSYLQGISWQVQGKKQLSWVRICFHLALLTFFFGYLFTIAPKIIQEAARRHQQQGQKEPSGEPSGEDGGGMDWEGKDKVAHYLHRLNNEPFPPQAKKNIKAKISEYKKAYFQEKISLEEQLREIFSLPWWQTTTENQDLAVAKKELDREHFGLEEVKQRILNYLAGKKRAGEKQVQILCLVGPAGTGKTSLAKSIAKAMGRKYVKISVGGVSDEGQIRGHRRTYIGSMPGEIIKGMKEAGVKNPVFLIDEVDKINTIMSFHGNPASALLEILDPEQNKNFKDNYLEIPYDLSQVFFICTANWIQNIPGPLLDRMDVIELPPYTTLDKVKAAKTHLIPSILENYKLTNDQLTFTDEAIEEIVKFYVFTGGMRQTIKLFNSIVCAFVYKQETENLKSEVIDLKKTRQYLGSSVISEDSDDYYQPGIVKGLAVSEAGGSVLRIEASCFPVKGKEGKLIEPTGNLGKIMGESVKKTYYYLLNNYQKFGLTEEIIKGNDIFLDFPEGAVPKDGPSAGIAITTAILSSLTGKVFPSNYAMTGEITSKGKVLEIGGLKEKLTAAYEDKLIDTVFIPRGNERHLEEIPTEIKRKLKIIPVDNFADVWKEIKTNIGCNILNA